MQMSRLAASASRLDPPPPRKHTTAADLDFLLVLTNLGAEREEEPAPAERPNVPLQARDSVP